MKVLGNYFAVSIICLILLVSCVPKQKITLYKETGEAIPAADSLYNYAKNLYKNAKYAEVEKPLKKIMEEYPTSEKMDDAIYILLLSKYRLDDYKGVVITAKKTEKLYKTKPTEPNILLVTAQSFLKLDEDYEAARSYFDIIVSPAKPSLTDKAEKKLKTIIETRLNFDELENLARNYDKTKLGSYLLFTAVKRGVEEGKENKAKKIYNHMKHIYPNNKNTLDAAALFKEIKKVATGGTIGFLAPLSGRYSVFGRRVKNGVELAIKGSSLRIVERNTNGNPIEAIRQVIDLIEKENVFIIIGPILSMPMIAVAGIANLLKVPIISPTATEEDITSIGPYVFQLNVGLGAQAREMAKYATGTLGYYKIAILNPDDAYGNSLADIFYEEAVKNGAQIVARQNYSEGTTDFAYQMKFIKEKKPEAIYIPCYPNEAIMIAPQLKYYRIHARILGADGWNDPQVVLKGEKYVERAIFSGNPTVAQKNSKEFKNFRQLYLSQFKTEPSRQSALGYDAAMIILKALEKGAKDTKSLATTMREIKPFLGASGFVNPNGVFEGTVPIFTIKKGEIVKLR